MAAGIAGADTSLAVAKRKALSGQSGWVRRCPSRLYTETHILLSAGLFTIVESSRLPSSHLWEDCKSNTSQSASLVYSHVFRRLYGMYPLRLDSFQFLTTLLP